uniref:Uncharacterized protein n=1 Tax=viral metagenome TaxID=1070528 RepID=A0A6C0KHE7_9ZZZZ
MEKSNEFTQLYSDKGEYLREMFTLEDFMSCPETKHILIEDHRETFEYIMEPKIQELYNEYKEREDERLSGFFYKDRGQGIIELLSIIYDTIIKEYDLEIFYNNPELANPLLTQIDNELNRKTEKVSNVKLYNKTFDWKNKQYI